MCKHTNEQKTKKKHNNITSSAEVSVLPTQNTLYSNCSVSASTGTKVQTFDDNFLQYTSVGRQRIQDFKCQRHDYSRHTGRHTDIQTDTQTHRQTYRYTDRHTDTHTADRKTWLKCYPVNLLQLKETRVSWCLTALSAQTGYIMPH